jgi:two-component system nitrogen regulation response regulator GlnG
MLLSVIQQGCVTRLGEVKERRVDVKLVVATHENLGQRVQQGHFRKDLYMRLNPAMALQLPELVDRTLDWPEMVEHALYTVLRQPCMQVELKSYVEPHGLPQDKVRVVCSRRVPASRSRHLLVWVPPASMDLLRTHTWPGNFREFAMWAENALWLSLAEAQEATGLVRPEVLVLRPALVSQWLQRATPQPQEPATPTHRVTIRAHTTLHQVASSCERQYFEALYLETGGDFSLMAERLLGDGSAARKVQLRFNQLGLRVRGFRHIVTA